VRTAEKAGRTHGGAKPRARQSIAIHCKREYQKPLGASTGPRRSHDRSRIVPGHSHADGADAYPLFTPVAATGATRRCAGLVLYSEIFQLTAPVRRLAVQLAGFGYLVFAPEVYHAYEAPGTVLGYDDAGKTRGNALKEVLPPTAFDADARGGARCPARPSRL